MENIKIYHSVGKGYFIAAIFCIVVGICELVMEVVARLAWDGYFKGAPWLFGLFLLGIGLSIAVPYWKEKNKKTPFLEVTDDKVIMSSLKKWEIPFSEVEEFFFTDITKQLIGIRYKKDVETQKLENARSIRNTVRKMNKMLVGAQEGIPTQGLSMKPQEIFDLLNQRLETYRGTHA